MLENFGFKRRKRETEKHRHQHAQYAEWETKLKHQQLGWTSYNSLRSFLGTRKGHPLKTICT